MRLRCVVLLTPAAAVIREDGCCSEWHCRSNGLLGMRAGMPHPSSVEPLLSPAAAHSPRPAAAWSRALRRPPMLLHSLTSTQLHQSTTVCPLLLQAGRRRGVPHWGGQRGADGARHPAQGHIPQVSGAVVSLTACVCPVGRPAHRGRHWRAACWSRKRSLPAILSFLPFVPAGLSRGTRRSRCPLCVPPPRPPGRSWSR